jgi:hypothetical protein
MALPLDARWRSPRFRRVAAWVGTGLLLLALTGAIAYVRAIPDWYQASDEAILEIDTLHAINGLGSGSINSFWAFGPYSRYGWRHPGPLYFYLLAPIYAAGGFGTPALKLGVLLINLAAFAFLVRVLSKHVAAGPRLVLLGFLVLYVVRASPFLSSVWNPHAVLLPLALALVLAAAVGSGHARYLPALAAVTSYVAQTNVALVPATAAAVMTALVLLHGELTASTKARAWVAWRSIWKSVVAAAAVSFVLWLPSLVEQVRGNPGNMTQLAQFFSAPNHRGQMAIDAWRAWADNFSVVLWAKPAIGWGSRFVPQGGTLASVLALAIVVLLHGVRRRAASRDHALVRSLGTVVFVASVVALWACTSIKDEINDYSVFWISVLGVLGAGVVLGLGLEWVTQRLGRPGWPRAGWVGQAAAVASMIAVTASGGLAFQEQRRAAEERARSWPIVSRLSTGLLHYMVLNGIRRPAFEMENQWSDAAGVILRLHRRGQRLAVMPDREFMFGPQFRLSGTEDRVFVFAERARHHPLRARPGDFEVASFGETCIHTIEPLDRHIESVVEPVPALPAEGAVTPGAKPAATPRAKK